MEILEKSKNRNVGDCTSYDKCGGCNLRHMNYQTTLDLKKTLILRKA